MVAQSREPVEECAFIVLRPGETAPLWRQELALMFILQGTGELRLEGNETAYAIGEGDLFVVNSFQMYALQLDVGALAIALLLSPTLLALLSPETAGAFVDCKSFLFGEDGQEPFDRLRKDFARAFRARFKQESKLSVHMRSRVAVLADNLYRNFMVPDKRAESGRERLREAVEYIQEHYRENLTLKDLSEHTYLSASHLSHSFQKQMGISFTGYLVQVRLTHAAALLQGEASVTDIAYQTGFPNANAFIEAFKQYRGMTPGQYRRELHKPSSEKTEADSEVGQEGFSTAFRSLTRYAESEEAKPAAGEVCEISCQLQAGKRMLKHNWKRLINAGYARDLLSGAVQEQLRRVQKAVSFKYVRVKGLLDDDMMVYCKNIRGEQRFNGVYLDEVIDFILSTGAKPMLEFSHMPSALAKHTGSTFHRATLISAPANIQAWGSLIEQIMAHLSERYGTAEMERWLFSPWTTPDFDVLGTFTREEYTETYTASYREIKKAGTGLRVCGPGSNVMDEKLLSWFLDMAQRESCLPDILSFRSFAAVPPDREEGGLQLMDSSDAFYLAVSGDEDYLRHALEKLRMVCEEKGAGTLPVALEEWSNNIWQRDLCNDTAYKSAYVFKEVLENGEHYHAMGYFNLTDQLDEVAPVSELFHGGFGLFTRYGLPKSAFRAMQLLGRMGDRLLAQGDGYCITANEEEVQLYLYHYCHYDTLYRYRHTANLTATQRYKVFNTRPDRSYHIALSGLSPGEHRVRRYSVSPKGGSSYDAWVEMGAPEPPSREEEKLLHRLSHPIYQREMLLVGERLELKAFLCPHEVQLITVARRAQRE